MKKDFIINTSITDTQIALFYLGQVGFIIKYKDKYILIDGYLSDYVDQNCCSENVRWMRRYPAPIEASELDFIDYVFCTHAHFDHADPDTLAAVNLVNRKAKFIVPGPVEDTIASYGISKNKITGVKCDTVITLDDDISFIAVPSAHEQLHCDENGDYYEVGFKIFLGDTCIFHSGDGCPYEGLEERVMGSDIMILPVNGRDYYRTNVCDIIGCFNSREAAIMAKNCNASLLIPVHFDLYDVNCINPAEFVDTLECINPNQAFHIFRAGERYIFAK